MKKSQDNDKAASDRRTRLPQAIDEAISYLVDETKNYSRDNFPPGGNQNLLASKVLALIFRDMGDQERMIEGWADWLVGWEPLKKVKITPEALEAAVKELKRIKRVRRMRARAELRAELKGRAA